jgi:hypothetical protein
VSDGLIDGELTVTAKDSSNLVAARRFLGEKTLEDSSVQFSQAKPKQNI